MPKREATEKDPCLPYSSLGDGHSAMPRRCGWHLPGAQSSRVTPPLLSCLGRSYFPIWYFSSKQQYHLGNLHNCISSVSASPPGTRTAPAPPLHRQQAPLVSATIFSWQAGPLPRVKPGLGSKKGLNHPRKETVEEEGL